MGKLESTGHGVCASCTETIDVDSSGTLLSISCIILEYELKLDDLAKYRMNGGDRRTKETITILVPIRIIRRKQYLMNGSVATLKVCQLFGDSTNYSDIFWIHFSIVE